MTDDLTEITFPVMTRRYVDSPRTGYGLYILGGGGEYDVCRGRMTGGATYLGTVTRTGHATYAVAPIGADTSTVYGGLGHAARRILKLAR